VKQEVCSRDGLRPADSAKACLLNFVITYRLRLHLAHFQAALLRVKVQVTLWRRRGTHKNIAVRQAPNVRTMHDRWVPGAWTYLQRLCLEIARSRPDSERGRLDALDSAVTCNGATLRLSPMRWLTRLLLLSRENDDSHLLLFSQK
jgi:hypothetical protein